MFDQLFSKVSSAQAKVESVSRAITSLGELQNKIDSLFGSISNSTLSKNHALSAATAVFDFTNPTQSFTSRPSVALSKISDGLRSVNGVASQIQGVVRDVKDLKRIF